MVDYASTIQVIRALARLASPDDVIPVSNASLPLDIAGRGLRVVTGGTVTVVTLAGQTRPLAFTDGETRLVNLTRIVSVDTTADGIEVIPPIA